MQTGDHAAGYVRRAGGFKTLNELGVDHKLSARAQKLAALADDGFEAELARWHEAADRDWVRVTLALLRGTDRAEPNSFSKIELKFARLRQARGWPAQPNNIIINIILTSISIQNIHTTCARERPACDLPLEGPVAQTGLKTSQRPFAQPMPSGVKKFFQFRGYFLVLPRAGPLGNGLRDLTRPAP